MKDLKQYIEESLLDDFDTLANNINPRDVIKQFLQTNYINPISKFVISKKPNENGLYEVKCNEATIMLKNPSLISQMVCLSS